MAGKKAAAPALADKPTPVPAPQGPSLEERVTELEGDLVRIVDLLVKGDLDSAKFKAILAGRQGRA